MLTRRALAVGLLALPAAARAEAGFQLFLAGVGEQARAKDVPPGVIDRAFRGLAPDPVVIERDQSQPEFTLTWPQYRARVLPQSRIDAARTAYQANQSLLLTIAAIYGVDPRVILAIWGVESNFGAIQGKFSLIRSLATLAYQGRRGTYFTGELIAALEILAHGYATADMLKSGWAGAMGQPQFMPSAYLRSAVDFAGDGRRDIWHSTPDALASIANYLSQRGWERGESWGERFYGAPPLLAPGDQILAPNGAPPDETYLVHPNFAVIKRYNPSDFYALTVGLLADAVG